MGLLEKISRKLSGSPSSDDIVTPNKPSSTNTSNESGEVRHVSPPHVRLRSENHQENTGLNTVNGKPGIIPTPNVGRNENFAASHTINTTGSQSQSQPRQSNEYQNTALPAQPTARSIAPPISRLNDSMSDSRNVGRHDANSGSAISSQQSGKTSLSIDDDPKRQHQSMQKQPSIPSSLHSSRPTQPKVPNMVSNQQAALGNMRGQPAVGQANLPKSAGRDTRRMEDGAYNAGFRDAIAQLQRERDAQGRCKAVSN